MMRIRTSSRLLAALYACCFALSAPSTASARTLSPGLAPAEVATEAYARMKAGHWSEAAEAFDPAALARFRTLLGPLLDAAGKPPGGAEDPNAAARTTLQVLFAPAKTVDEVRALPDAELFARVMSSTLSLAGASLERQQVLGTVKEGADLAHVIVRSTAAMGDHRVSRVEAISLHHTPKGWRLVLTGELEGLAESLQPATPDAEPAPPAASGRP